jgi:hypothetical protein
MKKNRYEEANEIIEALRAFSQEYADSLLEPFYIGGADSPDDVEDYCYDCAKKGWRD